MTDSLFGKFNATEFDADGSTGEHLNDTFVPAYGRLLQWTKAVVNHELSNKGWSNAATGTVLDGTSPVQMTMNREPEPSLLRQTSTAYPLLYVHHKEGTVGARTTELSQITRQWGMGYILGPLSPKDYERLSGALQAFPALVELMFRARAHSAYDSGADQFDANKVDFSSIALTKFRTGAATFGDQGEGMPFYMSELELVTTETEGDIAGVNPSFSGFDVAAKVNGIPEFVMGETV